MIEPMFKPRSNDRTNIQTLEMLVMMGPIFKPGDVSNDRTNIQSQYSNAKLRLLTSHYNQAL